jgi:hypothetical protein
MAVAHTSSIARTVRFLASLAPAALLLLLFFAVIAIVSTRVEGMTGGLLGALAAGSLLLGILLAYWIAVDWINLRIIRRCDRSGSSWRDGDIVAVEGIVRVDGEPMRSPFTNTLCAACVYKVWYSRQRSARGGRESDVLAQGFHLMRTRIEGVTTSVALRTLPSFETDLMKVESGRTWGEQVQSLVDERLTGAPRAVKFEREGRLIELRAGEIDEVHEDYRMGAVGDRADTLTIEEEVLPVGVAVCAVGTYRAERRSLTARRSRFGPNLMVYRGRADEVIARVGGENVTYTRAILVLWSIAAATIGLVLAWPVSG